MISIQYTEIVQVTLSEVGSVLPNALREMAFVLLLVETETPLDDQV